MNKTVQLRQRLENEKQYRNAVSTLLEVLARLRSEKTSMWFRERNSVSFWKLEENCSALGGKCCMVLNFEGTNRKEYVKRGAQSGTQSIDMKLIENAFAKMNLRQKSNALSEEEEVVLRRNVDMLLKQYANVTVNVNEKSKKKLSFKNILSSKAKTKLYPFSVMGVSFECEYTMLADLEFNSFEEIREFLMEGIIELSEKADTPEEEHDANDIRLKMRSKLVRYAYEVQVELTVINTQLVLQAKTIKPIAGK